MTNQTSSSLEELSKDELIELLQAAQAKNERMIRFIGSIFHETRAPTAAVLGYANLILVEGATAASRADTVKFVQGIKKAAERIQEAQKFSILWWNVLQFLTEPLAQTKISLAEIKNFEEAVGMPIKTDLASIPPILANEEVLITVIRYLGYAKSDEAVLKFSQDEDFICVILSNRTFQSYWVEKYLDSESGRLVFSSDTEIFEPIDLVIALVEKCGGAVYAELGNDSTYTLSFTLPIYQEEL
ncbi:MAG: hypothetical protein R3D55_23220 [Chloroflexota bacterium]